VAKCIEELDGMKVKMSQYKNHVNQVYNDPSKTELEIKNDNALMNLDHIVG
jgi:hypothetical protein